MLYATLLMTIFAYICWLEYCMGFPLISTILLACFLAVEKTSPLRVYRHSAYLFQEYGGLIVFATRVLFCLQVFCSFYSIFTPNTWLMLFSKMFFQFGLLTFAYNQMAPPPKSSAPKTTDEENPEGGDTIGL